MPAYRPPFWLAMPMPVRFLLRHGLLGFVLSAAFVAGMIWSDAFGMGHLLLQSASHPMPVLLLWFFSGLTLGSIQMGIAVMGLESDED